MFSEEINKVAKSAIAKKELLEKSKGKYLVSSMFAGFYVGLGIMLIFTIGGILSSSGSPFTKIIMGASFGIALSLVIFAGSELFTGNNFVMTIGALNGSVSFLDAIKVWIFSFLGNLLGSVLGAWLYFLTNLSSGPVGEFMVKVATAKMSAPASQLLVRGIMCNILVCLAVWCSFKMKEESGKLIMIFWCLFAFITTGFEHSIANMTLLSIALMVPHTAAVTLSGFIYNIGIVTIGNFIGGAMLLAIPYWYISKEK